MIIVNRASAGSGKTYTLVKQYLIMLLGKKQADGSYVLDEHPNDNHRFILAITFTNKATDEMKQRIVDTLDELAQTPDKSPYIKDLISMLHSTKEKISKSAGMAERQVLEDYTNFNVCTIDTFFQKILRTFAFEVNLAGNYGVELNDEYVVSLGVNSLKTAIRQKDDASTKRLREWLWQYIEENIKEGKSWNVFKPASKKAFSDSSLYTFAKALSKEVIKTNSDKLFKFLKNPNNITTFSKALRNEMIPLSHKIKDITSKLIGILTSPGINPNKRSLSSLQNIINANIPFDEFVKPEIDYRDDRGYTNKNSAPLEGTPFYGLLAELRETISVLESYRSILKYTYHLGLLGDINAGVLDFTTDNNTILLSGTNDIVRRIISGCEMPFIYERIGMYIHHYLIDEFQDTSRMQWENLLPLVRDSLANGHDSLIIGDVKQSIYRFRNSDPQLLHSQLGKDFPKSELQDNFGERSTNWRSAYNIVTWNNEFFKFLANILEMTDFYKDVEQEVSPKNQEILGHVSIAQYLPPEPSAEQVLNEEEITDKEAFNRWATARTIDDILSLLGRGYRQKDIAILVNKNNEGQTIIDGILEWNVAHPDVQQIKAVSEESLLVMKSPAVRIVVSILEMLDRCEDIKERGRDSGNDLPIIMRRYELNINKGISPSAAFEDAFANKDSWLDEETEALFQKSRSACLDGVVEHIIRTQLTEDMARDNAPYIQAFIDNVTDFMSRYGSNIHHFLKWWDKVGEKVSISSPDNIDAVKVMTIHKSKGLQFPCVILPMANWDFDKTGIEWVETESVKDKFPQGIEIPPILAVNRTDKVKKRLIFEEQFEKIKHDNIMDTLNKTYVACTRAQYELLIYIVGEGVKGYKDSSLYLSSFALKTEKDSSIVANELTEDEIESALAEGNHRIGDLIYELGQPTTRDEVVAQAKKETDGTIGEERKMPDYKLVSSFDRWELTSPDIILEERGTERYRGQLLHKVMEKVRTPDDLDVTLRRFQARGMVTRPEREEYFSMLSERLADPRVAQWFALGNRLLLEREIMTGGKGIKRPDRVVIKPNGDIIVIDYKFGERNDDNDNAYRRQVSGYINALSTATGTKTDCISGYIWYVTAGDIVAV